MKKAILLSIGFLFAECHSILAQDTLYIQKSADFQSTDFRIISPQAKDTLLSRKSLNFPAKKWGISIGNSYEFNGIRLNFADENVKRINGLNITFWLQPSKNQNAVVNGVSLGVFPVSSKMQPINIGLLGVGTANNNLNGISVGGAIIGSGGKVNGLSISGIMTMADGKDSKISGVAISGLGVGAKVAINGFSFAGFMVGTEGDINGFTSSIIHVNCEGVLRGIAITLGYLKSNILKGFSISGYSKSNETKGLSIALYNRTKNLKGVQIGLLNYAENNPKGFRISPIVNIHLKRPD
jgi:hypothetical protein